jgi:hypothetical protein
MEELRPIYSCGQDQLYGGADLVIKSLTEELLSFTAFKGKYTNVYVTDLTGLLNTAKNLPALEQRLAEQEVARINLLTKLTLCLDVLNALRLYIRDAYPNAEIRDVRLKEAGFDDYTAASNANWEKLSSIMLKGKTFIVGHEAELLANDNMPVGFKASFDALEVTLQPEIVEMLNLRENNKQGTSAKIMANNALHLKIMEVCEDGAYIFRNDAAKRVQFIWTSVLELITPPGAAGLRGEVRASGTNVVIENVMVVLLPDGLPEITVYTDAQGKYEFKNLPATTYLLKADKQGYTTYVEENVIITTGVVSTKNISLVAAV